MQGFLHQDPGPCLICGTAHCACAGGGATEVIQLPSRDAAAARTSLDPRLGPDLAPGSDAGPDVSAPLGDGSDDRPFSTASYRGTPRRGRSSRT